MGLDARTLNPDGHWVDRIDWKRVASRYAGIEICPYQNSLRMKAITGWYYPWDVASGCIWSPAGMKLSYVGMWDDKTKTVIGKDEVIAMKAALQQPLRLRSDYGGPEKGSMLDQLERMQEAQIVSGSLVAKELTSSAGYYYNRRGDIVIDDDNTFVKKVLKKYEELARAMGVPFKWKRVSGQIVVDVDDQDGFEDFLNKKGVREVRMASRDLMARELTRMAKDLLAAPTA
jgi:hypothetical protein